MCTAEATIDIDGVDAFIHLSEHPSIRERQLKLAGRILTASGATRRHKGPLSEERLEIEWLAVELTKQRAERPLIVGTRLIFQRQREAVLENIEQLREEGVELSEWADYQRKDPALVSRLFDLTRWNREIKDELSPRALQAIQEGFERGLSRIEAEGSFNANRPRVRQLIREVELQSEFVNRTTQETINELVTEANNEGLDFEELGERISDRFQDWERWRADMHGRTAGTASFEGGQLDSFEMAGVPKEFWLTQRDSRVRGRVPGRYADARFDHWEADGQTVAIDEPFEVSGEALKHPGDPSGSPGNIIHCRCTQVPQLEQEEE